MPMSAPSTGKGSPKPLAVGLQARILSDKHNSNLKAQKEEGRSESHDQGMKEQQSFQVDLSLLSAWTSRLAVTTAHGHRIARTNFQTKEVLKEIC